MSRLSCDQFINGVLFNGYDYVNQCWVINGIIDKCYHPKTMDCGCYSRKHAGEKTTCKQEEI